MAVEQRRQTRIGVALVITELEFGGAERCLTNLALGLDRSRFSVAVHSLAPRPPVHKQQLVARLEAAAIPVQFVGARSYRQFGGAVGRLRRQLEAQRPDIVQTFLFHANVVGALAARRLAGTLVVGGVRVADPSRWRHWLERWVARYVSCLVCVIQSVADFCVSTAGLPADKLLVIPNGIDVGCYGQGVRAEPASYGIAPGRRAIVFVGRLDQQKGLDWFLGLCPALLSALPDHDVLLVGEGPQRKSLEVQAQTLGLRERVHFAGWRADVPGLLAAAAMAVLPSRWEGMPNFLLEAMASGLPVVCTRAAGVEELLGPLAAEQSVPLGDGSGLVSKAVRIAHDRSWADQLGRENRQRAERHFSLPAMISSYERCYCRLAGSLGKLG